MREEVIKVLERFCDILIGQFSYDGEDPKGVKGFQRDVDEAQALIERLKARREAQ